MKDSPEFNQAEIDRIIMMAWEDRTPFEAIEAQFGLKEAETKKLMRKVQPSKTYKRWRERVNSRKTKHKYLRSEDVQRFKSYDQKS